MENRYGATPAEWARFDLICGLTSDLLPVVSRPGAQISPLSKIKTLGKTPSLYNRLRFVTGMADWTSHQTTPEEITKWSKERDYGICLQTREVRAIDNDIDDPVLAKEVTDFVSLQVSALPARVRNNSGKSLLAFRIGSGPVTLPKRIIRCNGGIIEFLANGQQFIAAGTHTSGARYEWQWNGHADFPQVDMEQFEALWAGLVAEFAIEPVTSAGRTGLRNAKDAPALDVADPTLDKLEVLGYGPEGQAYITCPFAHEHTGDSGITETLYFPAGTRGYEQGHFKCLHAHCEGRDDGAFLDALGLRAAEFDVITDEETGGESVAAPLPMIKLRGGGLEKEVGLAQDALVAAGKGYYQRASVLVRSVSTERKNSKGDITATSEFVALDPAFLTGELCAVAKFMRYDVRSKKWNTINPPPAISATLLSWLGKWNFPIVTGVITTPTLRPDGSLLDQPGYDEQTQLLLQNPPQMPAMPAVPTKADAQAGVKLLRTLLKEFPFVDDASISVALSTLITPIVRGAFPTAPMHVMRAPSPGSGKSYLLVVASTIATGQLCPVMAAGRTEEETEKRLGAALISGQPIISIDNVNGELGGDFLCQAIERPVVEIRPLGKSEKVRIESRSTIFATGNNIKLVGDMTRRVMLCCLDSQQERPELRKFVTNPVSLVMEDRGKYVAACLNIVRAYIEAGQPNIVTPRIASFEGWSDTVRSALVWLGFADPAKSIEKAREEDPHLQNMTSIFSALENAFGAEKRLTCADITRALYEDFEENEQREHLKEILTASLYSQNGVVSSKVLGVFFSKYKDRIASGLQLKSQRDKHGRGGLWWVSRNHAIRSGVMKDDGADSGSSEEVAA